MERSVMCTVTSTARAEKTVAALRQAGFARERISVLLPDRSDDDGFVPERHTKAPEGTTAGVTTGGVLGGALGWLVGVGTLAIPGLGPFIAAGPILAALSGIAVGATVGGVTGALIGLGIPEYEAKTYEGKLARGNILLSVATSDADERKRVREVFESNGGGDVITVGEEGGFLDESGATGWVLLWLLGVPIPVLLILFVLRGCT
jgi:uncharacterized protein YcfJ